MRNLLNSLNHSRLPNLRVLKQRIANPIKRECNRSNSSTQIWVISFLTLNSKTKSSRDFLRVTIVGYNWSQEIQKHSKIKTFSILKIWKEKKITIFIILIQAFYKGWTQWWVGVFPITKIELLPQISQLLTIQPKVLVIKRKISMSLKLGTIIIKLLTKMDWNLRHQINFHWI